MMGTDVQFGERCALAALRPRLWQIPRQRLLIAEWEDCNKRRPRSRTLAEFALRSPVEDPSLANVVGRPKNQCKAKSTKNVTIASRRGATFARLGPPNRRLGRRTPIFRVLSAVGGASTACWSALMDGRDQSESLDIRIEIRRTRLICTKNATITVFRTLVLALVCAR
jgi:hypothetical protein